jgi:hypothetical protein
VASEVREPILKRRLSKGDLFVQTSLDQLLLIMEALFTLFTKQGTLMRRLILIGHPLQLVFPASVLAA